MSFDKTAVTELPAAPPDPESYNPTERDERFRMFLGNSLIGLFGVGYLDQGLVPDVRTSLEWTGRLRANPVGRVRRTMASEFIAYGGFDHDVRDLAQFLIRAHRDVRGSAGGQRFSALSPDNWNFVALSLMMLLMNCYTPITGEQLTSQDRDALYRYIHHHQRHIQLPGKSHQLPTTFADANRIYVEILDRIGQPSLPVRLPKLLTGALVLANPLFLLGFAVMHPYAHRYFNLHWTRAHQLAFRVSTWPLPFIWRRFPKRLTLNPVAYRRWKYEQTVNRYRSRQLEFFGRDR